MIFCNVQVSYSSQFQGIYNILKSIGTEEKYRIVVGNTGQGNAEGRVMISFGFNILEF